MVGGGSDIDEGLVCGLLYGKPVEAKNQLYETACTRHRQHITYFWKKLT